MSLSLIERDVAQMLPKNRLHWDMRRTVDQLDIAVFSLPFHSLLPGELIARNVLCLRSSQLLERVYLTNIAI